MGRERSSKVGLIVTVVILGLLLVFSGLLNLGLFAGLRFVAGSARWGSDFPRDAQPRLQEYWSCGRGDAKVVRIGVEGLIMRAERGSGFFGPGFGMVESVLREIRAAKTDRDVRAIILELNSPGGAITPTDEIYRALLDFKASHPGRVVMVFVRDVAASGAYYIAMAGDRLMAEPTSMVGSVGVIMQTLNWSSLSKKIGLKGVTLKSGRNKDLLNPFEPVDPEQVEVLDKLLESHYRRFVAVVSENRALDKDLLDGSVFSTQTALENGMLDEVGYWDEAVAGVADLLGVDAVRVVAYEKSSGLRGFFQATFPSFKLPGLQIKSETPFYYLWNP